METKFEVWTPVTFASMFYATFAEAMRAARRLQAYGFTAYLCTTTTRSRGGYTDTNAVTLSFDGELHFLRRVTSNWNGNTFTHYVVDGRHIN